VPLSDVEDLELAVVTPWGDASELRERRLYPGSGTPPEEVARNQRERLFGAAVAVASQKGFEAMTVADVLALSGVSRSAFYRHFGDKSECLVAAAGELMETTLGVLERRGESPEASGLGGAFADFLAVLDSQPAAARICFVELYAVGEPGEVLGDRAFERAAAAIAARGESAGGLGADPVLARALLTGMRKLIHSRVARGEEAELAGLGPELWDWIASVEPPPSPLEIPRRQRQAPGPRFAGYTPGERIARAVAAVVSEKGYGATSTDDIAARASISLSTFYANFEDKRDAVLGALEMSGAQITALAVPAARRAGDWQLGVRALYEAICAYFVAEPEMAELVTVGVYGAGPGALARRDRVIESLGEMLAPAFEENPSAPPVSVEAIGASVYGLMRDQLRREGPESLGAVVPLATYVTLAGFVGAERACAVANGAAARR
jgi:AcrR family transcriptional regulator